MGSDLSFHIGPIPITMTLVSTWAVMAAVVGFAMVLRGRLRVKEPCKAQQVTEAMVTWLGDEIKGIISRDPAPFIPIVGSLFIFILVANLTSLVSSFVPGLKPPTADIATTAALATVVFFAVPVYGILMTGTVNYLRTYIQPTWLMLPLNIVSELSRTLALAVRLFGNIFSGEILIGVVVSLVPFFLPTPLMILSLITGVIQAYIFAVLAVVYIGGAVKVVEKHGLEETKE